MKNVLLSTAAWPNLHYLFYLVNSDSVFVEQHETYPRQTFRNRYKILSANGPLNLTIPVRRSGNHTKTKDILIDYSSDWQTQHWRALTSAYKKSPFFEHFEDEVRIFYTHKEEHLITSNYNQVNLIVKLLRLSIQLHPSDRFEKHPSGRKDLRGITDPKTHWSEDPEAAVSLNNPYYQTFREKFQFVPNLSVLDLLFNLGLKGKEYITKLEITS